MTTDTGCAAEMLYLRAKVIVVSDEDIDGTDEDAARSATTMHEPTFLAIKELP
jgi:hypothetical protein